MSEPKMQIKVKSYDITEFEIEVSVEEGQKLIKLFENEVLIEASVDTLLNIREIIGNLRDHPLNYFERILNTDAAFNMIDKLIKDIEGATYAKN